MSVGVSKVSVKALIAATAAAGIMFGLAACGESKEEPKTTTTTTTTTTEPSSTAPSEAPTVAPTTKGSLEPVGPKPGDIGQGQVGEN
ncbi:MAG: hypothetical protein HYZ38_16775 [Mycobacterium sp.]|nr:hypothetical protein [Mycobacterium sp.]